VPNVKRARTGYEQFQEEIKADLGAIRDKQRRKNGNAQDALRPDSWPEPERLDPLPAVQQFDEALLPDALRPFVMDTAERMQIPPDLPAVVAVAALAGVVNHRAQIQPKQWDNTWTVTPNLWASLIVPSGFLKSPTIEVVTRPLRRIEKNWKEQYDQDFKAHALEAEESGRALVLPAYVGTLERGPTPVYLPPALQRDLAIQRAKDASRTIDYLETRSDIEVSKLGLYGLSTGAHEGMRVLATEPRFKAAVLMSLRTGEFSPPKIDSRNFAPRVKARSW
jgi:hypothetical protein